MDVKQISRELVRELLKPPIELVAVSHGTLPDEAGIKIQEDLRRHWRCLRFLQA
ncbi:hypothetical protein LCGC14_1539370 [marine sediment metagenome]|uniref:Uncharacterized protein n=1 Tax=marine sediment metagenome TaxID=412755 RepID=A0A0F9ITK7_9ZZZZ